MRHEFKARLDCERDNPFVILTGSSRRGVVSALDCGVVTRCDRSHRQLEASLYEPTDGL